MTTPLWQPTQDNIQQSHLYHFMKAVGIQDYEKLYQWSIDQPEQFWKRVAEFFDIRFSQPSSQIMRTEKEIWKTKWFVDAKLNFAENLLWKGEIPPAPLCQRGETAALIYANENGERAKISYRDLFLQTQTISEKLKSFGVQPGDRVAALATNRIETVVAMLATASLGAIWSACGPEFGIDALVERFSQIEPVILFAVSEHCYQGKKFAHHETISELQKKILSIQKIIYLDDLKNPPGLSAANATPFSKGGDVLASTHTHISFPFDHPLYILYSSGTTGKPKCMVHGAGNVLIQHKKELLLHTDLHETDTIFLYTTCSWMMWHWMISSLSVGATVVLYDGSPFYPLTATLFDLIDEFSVSIFGCGAKLFETHLKNNIKPKNSHQLKKLKTILTTGSPLLKESFEYIYRDVKKDLRVSSISGGSDIVSCFALGNPLLPVYAEELQCRGLGMKVEIFDDNGKSVVDEQGELVCTAPFPSMPLYFWNDTDGGKYFHAYFDRFKNVWTHGDFAKITKHNGLIIYGRSDATLNPGGIRIGTADIYQQVLKIPDILDCVAVGKQNYSDEEIILFVKLKNGMTLDEKLTLEIKKIIRDNTTPHHVPKKIIQVSDIPKTLNGKTMEIAVKNIVNGRTVKNIESLANPECLDEFKKQ